MKTVQNWFGDDAMAVRNLMAIRGWCEPIGRDRECRAPSSHAGGRHCSDSPTKKSHASAAWAWLRTNVLHRCDERSPGRSGLTMYRRTVRGETWMPSLIA